MKKCAAIIAAMDTKGEEARFVRDVIRGRGHETLTIDVGIFQPRELSSIDIASSEVARAGGAEISALRVAADKANAMDVMTRGAAALSARLYSDKRFHAVIGIGGSAGTSIASSAMRALPVGVPKLLVSTVAAADTRPYVGNKDVTLMYSVVDIAGINRITARVLSNAAAAVAGMLETTPAAGNNRPLIFASMFGNTTACVDRARSTLSSAGFEVLVFHATGVGGKTMEELLTEEPVTGVLDITTTELADELCGGLLSAGHDRVEAAGRAGIPQVVAPGCLDMVNFWGPETVPGRFAGRRLFHWNPNVTLMRTNVEESAELGRILARKLSMSAGPVSLMLPLLGVSQLDSEGGAFWWPEADEALFRELKANVARNVRVLEVDANINDPEFADLATEEMLSMLPRGGV